MTYTYDDFIKAATNASVLDRFSKDDLTVAQKNPEYGLSMVGLMGDISKATTEEQRLLATEAANQLRKNYGIYGTGDTYATSFSTQIGETMDKINNYGSFEYGQQNAYQQLMDSVANPGSFSYDPNSDQSFQAYRKAYLREGERASANALAQASAASGGVPSSFAVSAAQQAGNYYSGQLADMIPTLEQNAYQRYLEDYNQKLSGLSALQTDRSFDYDNWLNQYNMLQNSLGNLQTQDATDYQRYLDQQTQAQQKFENALTMYQLLGYATPEIAEILGLPTVSEDPTPSGGSSDGGGYSTDALAKQQELVANGYNVAVDGIWGPESIAAWEAYQAALSEENQQIEDFNYNSVRNDIIEANEKGLSKSEIQEMINTAYKEGIITQAQQMGLSKIYNSGK